MRCELSSLTARHALADVLGEIADPFEIVGDAHHRHQCAQIDRHRLAQRNGRDGFFLDLPLQTHQPSRRRR